MQKFFKKLDIKSLGTPKDLIALSISIVSFLISSFTLYSTRLKAPDITFTIAPYLKHVVDDRSLNEAFFIPITITNRGAQPGTLLAFELTVTRLADGEQQTYYGQYLAQPNNPSIIGDFFTPITLYGQSSVSHTVCFYPPGQRRGSILTLSGDYSFSIRSRVANGRERVTQTPGAVFSVRLDDDMLALLRSQPDGEYPYPLTVELRE